MKTEKIPNTRCEICGKEFYAIPSHLKRGWGKYCSKECKDKAQRKGKFVICSYCGKEIYRSLGSLQKESKTKTYFCNKSCQCAWKNKQRKTKKRPSLLKYLWRSWCNSSIRTCGVLGAGAHPVDLPKIFLKHKKKKSKSVPLKRPSKKTLYNLYWRENKLQTEIAEIFGATHTSVKRWFIYYKIPIKSRTLSCGQNPNSIKNLDLGKTPEVERKSAEARKIYTRKKLIQKIRKFVEQHSRPPTKNEFANNSSYPHFNTFQEYFGSWNKAIEAAGYKPNEQWFSSRNLPKDLRARDRHPCNSVSEIIVDDWLFKNGIPHQRECLYPERKYCCDFVVDNIFIEFFGLANISSIDLDYPKIMKKKRKLCKKYNISLIELFEKDLYNLDQSLGEKLEKIKVKSSISIFRNIIDSLSKVQSKFF